MTFSPGLRIERDGPAWTFILERPAKRNALSAEMVEAMIDGLAAAHQCRAQLLVFRGEGANFSAGFDFSDIRSVSDGDLLYRIVRIETLLQAIAASPCLTLGLAHGRNFGAGVDLLAACRWRVAAPDTSFRMPGLKFGLVLGTRRFAGLVGAEAARSVLEAARAFDAREAQDLRLLTRIAAPSQWAEVTAEALNVARTLSDEARAQLYSTLSERDDDGDLARLVRSASSPGLRERIVAYLESRN